MTVAPAIDDGNDKNNEIDMGEELSEENNVDDTKKTSNIPKSIQNVYQLSQKSNIRRSSNMRSARDSNEQGGIKMDKNLSTMAYESRVSPRKCRLKPTVLKQLVQP